MGETRTVKVVVTAVADQYLGKMREVSTAARSAAGKAEQAFAKQKISLDQVGRAAAVASAAFTVAFVAMVKASADFEQRMSQVQALSKATAAQMTQLRGAAFEAGKAFGLSATQVADAQIELTKAGVSVKDIIGGALPGALALAAAGQIDVAKATEIASNAMTEFGLKGKDVPHLADLLAAGADKSVASVASLGDALNQSGLVASQFGLSAEDTIGTLTAFSKAGLNGSDAGTAFKTMLLSLASPSRQAQKYLDEYNISAYDSQGAFVGITGLADQLQQKLGGLSQAQRNAALSTIFGTDAIRAANVLYTDGAKGIQGFIDGNNEAGFAALQASKKLDNLNGDLQKLSASFQNDLIKSGSGANLALRGVAQTANGLLEIFGKLPSGVQGSAVVIAGVGAAVTGLGAAFLLLVPRIVAAKDALAGMGVTGKSFAAGIGRGGVAILGLTALTSALAATEQQGAATAQQLSKAADVIKGGFGAGKNSTAINSLIPTNAFAGIKDFQSALNASYSGDFSKNTAGITKAIDGLSFGITHFSDTYKSSEGQIKALGTQFASLANTDYSGFTSKFGSFIDTIGGGKTSIQEMISGSEDLKNTLTTLAGQAGVTASDTNLLSIATGRGGAASALRTAQAAADKNAQALQAMAGSAADAKVDISVLSKTIAGFGGATLDARSAQRAFEQAVEDARTAVTKNGKTLNINTAAGRDNQAALDGIASAASAAASKILEQTGSTDKAAAAMRKGRKDFIAVAQQMGLTKSAAGKLADQLGLIPSNVKTAVSITGIGAALSGIALAKAALASLNGRTANVAVHYSETGKQLATGGAQLGFASGGPITGPGPKGKDSVLAYLAPGEHVLTAKEVDKMGGQGAVYAFRKGIQAYATGGAIGDASRHATLESKSAANLTRLIKSAKDRANHLGDVYDAIDGTKANKSKKSAAKKAKDAADKNVADLEKMRDTARQQASDFRAAAASLRNDREDFVSTQRRATPDNPVDPLSYVDQLRSMSRDDNFTGKRRAAFDKAANKYEKSLVTLADKSAKASQKLDDLKSSADSMRSGIVSAITGGYSLAGVPLTGAHDASTKNVASGYITRDGIRMQTYNQVNTAASDGTLDAAGIAKYYAAGATNASTFAADLKTLAGRGLNGQMLAEIANYGVAQGAPIAKALLAATTGQIASINTNYAKIGTMASIAAGTVTDVNYKALIDNAQKNADQITAQIAADGEKLRKLIASAFGLSGYASGTDSAGAGWHLVGEKGPELANFGRGGGAVKTNRWLTAAMAANGGNGAPTKVVMQIPDTITVRDLSGFEYRMQTVANRAIDTATQALVAQYPG